MIKGRIQKILSLCGVSILYIFFFKIDIFSSDDNTINKNEDSENENFCTEEECFFNSGKSDFSFSFEYNPEEIIKKEFYNEKKGNEKEYKNNFFVGPSLCSINGNEKQINNINIDENINVSFEKGEKGDLNKENSYFKKRKRRSKETIEKSIKKNGNKKNSRGRYSKEEIITKNYVPNVDDYSDIRHSKYSRDNIILKIKTLIINEIIRFLNTKITQIYKVDDFYSELEKLLEKSSRKDAVEYSFPIFKNMFKKKQILFNLNGNFILKMKNKDDKNLLHQNIRVIVSNEISKKFKNYNSEHNKFIIEGIQWKDEINEIFNLTFLDCVNHFCSKKINKNLIDFADWNTYAKKIKEKEEKEFIDYFKEVLCNFEEIVNSLGTRDKNEKNNK